MALEIISGSSAFGMPGSEALEEVDSSKGNI